MKPTHSPDRRTFIATGAAISAGALLAQNLPAAPTRNSKAEEAVRELYGSLSDSQRKIVALPLEDGRRTKISANWSITEANIGSFGEAQKEMIHRVLRGITSEEGYERFTKQMVSDWGSVDKYSIAIFGDPNEGQFEFELTGRHLTLRADGNTLPGPAFGGPIVYGHSARGNSDKNLYSYQTRRANEVFQALDEKQRKLALLENAPKETAIQLGDEKAVRPGIAGGDLSDDQQQLLLGVLKDLLAPYREEDVSEAMKLVDQGGGVKTLNIAFYKTGDLDADESWDIWRLESPNLVCHFRGAPHVHAYINVAKRG